MAAISIRELHEHTDLWVRKASEEPVILTDGGQAVAKIVPVLPPQKGNPFLTRKLLPGFAELQAKLSGGAESTLIISEMRDGR
jgi:antitoxin (DNA-binding transcriptional repressor) of toxin-antitoxin stability system